MIHSFQHVVATVWQTGCYPATSWHRQTLFKRNVVASVVRATVSEAIHMAGRVT